MEKKFVSEVAAIAVPASLQTLLQISVLSLTDQVMIGQLGSVSIAAVGIANKFSSSYSLLIAGIASVAGIMVSQYIGSGERQKVTKSFSMNILAALIFSLAACAAAILFPNQIAGIYTPDEATRTESATYLYIIAWNYIPIALITLLSTMFRCMNRAKFALYISIISTSINVVLDYYLIFGFAFFPEMGSKGAAIATVTAQWISCIISIFMFIFTCQKQGYRASPDLHIESKEVKRFFSILLPIVMCTISWLFADNVYSIIYGNMGTLAYAAITILAPIQLLTISMAAGLASSSGILIAKSIGDKKYDEAYQHAKKLLFYALVVLVITGAVMIAIQFPYVNFFRVEDSVKTTARHLITIFALTTPIRMMNMILGGNILRSGGNTKYIMYIDMIGSWCVGVPLAFFTARFLNLPIEGVNLIVTIEELFRLIVSLVIFKRKKWMYQ